MRSRFSSLPPLLLLVSCLSVLMAPSAYAQDTATMSDLSAKQLFKRIHDTSSLAARLIYRSYLAKKFPVTVEGLYARYWLESDGAKKITLLRAAVAKDPTFLYAWVRLGIEAKGAEKIPFYAEVLQRDPMHQNGIALRNTYSAYLYDLNDKTKAEAFLTEWEQKLPGKWIFSFLRGETARYSERNYPKAATYYRAAIAKEPDALEAYTRYADLGLDNLSDIKTPSDERIAYLKPIVEYAARQRIRAQQTKQYVEGFDEAFLYLGDRLFGIYKSRRQAFDMYREAFHVHETAEAAIKAFEIGEADFQSEVEEYLRYADTRLPHNYKILQRLGQHYAYKVEADTAEKYYRAAIAYAPDSEQRLFGIASLAGNVYDGCRFDHEKAESLLRDALAGSPKNSVLLNNLVWNRRFAQDWEGALIALNRYEDSRTNANHAFFASQRAGIEYHRSQSARAARYDRDNPLRKQWRTQFGGDALDMTNAPAFAEAATLLAKPENSRWIVTLRGTKEGIESGRVTLTNKGIAPDRIDTHEQATSSSTFLVLSGTLSEPSVADSASLKPYSVFAVSPDGHYAALGDTLQIWDLRKNARLRDLGRGIKPVFSPDGRFVAASSRYVEQGQEATAGVYVYDVQTGQVAAQWQQFSEIENVAWNPNGRQVAFSDNEGVLIVADVLSGRRIRARRTNNRQITACVLWSADGRFIVTGQAQDTVLRIWNAADLSLYKELSGVDWPHALGQTKAFTHLLCIDNRHRLTIWDTVTWKPNQQVVDAIGKQLVAHPDGRHVVMNGVFGGAEQNTLLIDAPTATITAKRTISDYVQNGFSQDGKILYEAQGAMITRLDGLTLEEKSRVVSSSENAIKGIADAEHDRFITSDSGGVHVWDIRTGRKLHRWTGMRSHLMPLPASNGRYIAVTTDAVNKTSQLSWLDTGNFTETPYAKLPLTINEITFSKDGKTVVVAGTEFPKAGGVMPSVDGTVLFLDATTGMQTTSFKIPLATEYLLYGTLFNAGFHSVALSPDNREFAVVTYWQDGNGHQRTDSQEIRFFDATTGAKKEKIASDTRFFGVEYAENGTIVTTTATELRWIYNRESLAYLRTEPAQMGGLTALPDGASLRRMAATLERLEKDAFRPAPNSPNLALPSLILGVGVYPKRNIVAVYDASNRIVLCNIKTLEPVLTVVAKRGNEWLAYATSGEFSASESGAKTAFWTLGDRLLSFDALARRFEKPNLLVERLELIAKSDTPVNPQPAPSPDKPIFTPDEFIAPYTIAILSQNNIETTEDTYRLRVKVTKRRADLPDAKLEFSQQNRDIGVEAVANPNKPEDGTIYEKSFPLAEGLNVLQVTVNYKNTRMLPQTILISRKAAVSNTPQSTLWFLGVGVSDYKKEGDNLRFADKDASRLADLFLKQKGKLYKDVQTRLLLNADATNQGVKVAMNEFLRQAGANDVIVVLLAGHGVQDSDQTLYFMTHDSDLAKPYTGTNLMDISRFLQARPPTQKAVLLMDICHAGSLGVTGQRGAITQEEAVKQLADGTGLLVLASSTGRESSLEGTEYGGGHGAFTAALLEVMEGQANSEPTSPLTLPKGFVTLIALQQYLSERVPKTTRGRQHPTMPEARQLRDFPFLVTQ